MTSRREGFRSDHDPTNAYSALVHSMEERLADIRDLFEIANYGMLYGSASPDPERLSALGISPDAAEASSIMEDADVLLSEFPLCVETTTTFEIVLGTGGPDDRLLIECDGDGRNDDGEYGGGYTIRRVLYRYSWSGSAEVELSGEDRTTAEEFAHRVVPELVE